MGVHLTKQIVNDLVMVLLALISVMLLIYDVIANVTIENQRIIHYIDLLIAFIFLGEFVIHFSRAKDKTKFFKHRWWELLAAIPITTETTQALRAINLARFLPLIEGLRFIRLAVRIKLMLEASKTLTKHTYMINIAIIVCVVILLGAFGFHYFEARTNPHVKSFFDSVWWAIVTAATIGYGDIYPTTTGGRIVAIILMFTGIGALGAFIAAINSYVINRNREKIAETQQIKPYIDK